MTRAPGALTRARTPPGGRDEENDMIVHVNVTQADIKRGDVASCDTCPEAIALQRATGNPYLVVNYHCVRVRDNPLRIVELPPIICSLIDSYDRTGRMKPHEWHIDLPDDWVKNGSGK
jgi:hypothetical protein